MFEFSSKSTKIQSQLQSFMDKHIYPNERAYAEQLASATNRYAPVS